MIEINSAQAQDKIIELLNAYNQDGITYSFKEKKGIKLIFNVTGDEEEAAKVAKASIKAQPWGGVLYFNAVPHK